MASPGQHAAATPAIELRDVSKSFGGVHALRGAHLTLAPGEVHALVGENGAGKSTLVRIMGGVHRPDEGTLLIGGEETHLHGPGDARSRGVAIIYQEPQLFGDLDVAENIFMGRHPRDGLRRIDWKEMYREVDELLRSLGVSLTGRTPVEGLSVADQQLVEIAKALSLDARVVVMDEPTAALSSREVERLFGITRDLRARGVAVLFISHRLEEVFALADTVTVLRDGGHVITAPTSELDTAALIRHMVGRELGDLFPKEDSEIGQPILEARGLTREGVFRDVSFSLRRGEILGFAGLVGAGRSEVARAIFGIDPLDEGEVLIDPHLGGRAGSRGDHHHMERVCFILRLRPERLAEYRERHPAVWPEMLDALRQTGWSNYSLFLGDDGLLVGYLETDDFEAARAGMEQREVNARWQAEMAPFFEIDEGRPDTAMQRLDEVFHLA